MLGFCETEKERERDHTLRSKSVSVAGIVPGESFGVATMADEKGDEEEEEEEEEKILSRY